MRIHLPVLRWLQILLLLGMVVAGISLYPLLPEQLPSHWGVSGAVDGWMPKYFGLWLIPGIAIGLSLLLPFLTRIDPLRPKHSDFERVWLMIQLTMVVFFSFVYLLQLRAGLYPETSASFSRLLLGGLGLLFAVLGSQFPSIPRNSFVGIRTPWTLADDGVWRVTHRIAGRIWMLAGAIIVLESILWIGMPLTIMITVFVIAVLTPVLYSLIALRRKNR